MKNVLRDTTTIPRTAPARDEAVRENMDEIDLLTYARALARRWYVLAAVAVAAAGLTYAVSRQIAPTYEVEFRLMVTEPRIENTPTSDVRIATYRALVESQTQVAALLREFRLDQPPHNLTPQRFLEDHVSVGVIRDTSIIQTRVRLDDRDLLVKVAQRYAEQLVQAAQRLSIDGLDYTTRRIGQERDAALRRLTALEESVGEYRRRNQLELLQRDVETMLARRPEALDLTVRIQGERARLQQAEAELAAQRPVRDVRRAIDSLPSAPPRRQERAVPPPKPAENARDAEVAGTPRAADPAESPERLDVRSELLDPYVNPVYELLQRDVSTTRTRLAGLEQERRELVSRLGLDAPSAAKLTRLYEAEAGLTSLTRDRDVARAAYVNAATKFEEARLQSTIRTPRLQILDEALPPDRPVAPRPVRNAAAAMLIALTLASVAILIRDGAQQRAAA